MSKCRVIAIILSVIALLIGFISLVEADTDLFSAIALGHLVVGIVGFAIVLAPIPDKK